MSVNEQNQEEVALAEYKEHLAMVEYEAKLAENEDAMIKEFARVINCFSRENESNTPDFIIAEYLYDCLKAYEKIHNSNEQWYGKNLSIIGDGSVEKLIQEILKRFDIYLESNEKPVDVVNAIAKLFIAETVKEIQKTNEDSWLDSEVIKRKCQDLLNQCGDKK